MTNLVTYSKFLSLILRHKPETIDLKLDAQGWANLDELIRQANLHHQPINLTTIQAIVHTNDKQRFIISDDGLKIRANQGHSVTVDLQLTAQTPPEILYHGTATRFLESILKNGLKTQQRQFVHLSSTQHTAYQVGQRHGKPVILAVAAAQMAQAGYVFFVSVNQVWLVEKVPAAYLTVQ